MFSWMDYVDLARELGARGDEAAQRSAISRSYYAVFGIAHERLIERGWQAGSGRPHHLVWSAYQTPLQSECHRAGELGFLLRHQRNIADDRRPLPVTFVAAREVEKALRRATWLRSLFERLDPDEHCF